MIMIALIKIKPKKQNKKNTNHFSMIKKGFKYLSKEKSISLLLLLTIINNLFIMGPAIIGIPVYVKEVLNEGFLTLTKLEVSMSIGMIVGSLIFSKLIKKLIPSKILIFGIIIDGLTYSLLFLSLKTYSAMLILFVHGIAIPLITISRTSMLQNVIPNHYRGRIFSIVNMSVVGTTAISILLTGIFLEKASSDYLFLIIGILASLTASIPLLFKNSSYRLP
tara:strand:+ start:248 stop:910 length:663 start_codon:yes stop_codon:yes gene_type:complete